MDVGSHKDYNKPEQSSCHWNAISFPLDSFSLLGCFDHLLAMNIVCFRSNLNCCLFNCVLSQPAHSNPKPTRSRIVQMAGPKPKSVKHSSDQNKAANKQDVDAKGFHHFRYIIIIFGGLMTGSMVFLRLSISVPMLSMVNKTAIYLKEHPNSTLEDLRDFFPPDYVETGEFLWTNEIQQVIMTGYMVAYGLPQFFTTKLAMKYGVRKSVPLSLALCGISSLLTPVMSYWGWQWCLVLRLINAVGGSALWPVMVNVIELWMPKHEAAKGLALIQFVSNFGYISAPLLGGYLTHLINWKAAFYIPGIVTLILCLLWYIISADEPASSRFLSQKELNYINGTNSDDPKKIDDDEGPKTELPWYFMFKIKSFYPLCIVWFLYCCSLHGFLFLMPSYLNRLLQIPIEEVGALNSTIQIGLLFCMLWPAPAASFLQEKFNLSLTAARNILVTTGKCKVICRIIDIHARQLTHFE